MKPTLITPELLGSLILGVFVLLALVLFALKHRRLSLGIFGLVVVLFGTALLMPKAQLVQTKTYPIQYANDRPKTVKAPNHTAIAYAINSKQYVAITKSDLPDIDPHHAVVKTYTNYKLIVPVKTHKTSVY